MAANEAAIFELPPDIAILIFPYLSPSSFLCFTSTCKKLHQYRSEYSYWKSLTRETFRLPANPLLDVTEPDRWAWLYKHLRTQTQVYTWGASNSGNLGRNLHGAPHDHYPTPILPVGYSLDTGGEILEVDMGMIVDVQCGGWSTVVMNSKGQLFMAGKMSDRFVGRPRHHRSAWTRLEAPIWWPTHTTDDDGLDSAVSVREYSVGRSHVLGLSDEGRIWCWWDKAHPAVFVESVLTEFVKGAQNRNTEKHGVVTKVVAGWGMSTAYVNGTGLIYWTPVFVEVSPGPARAETTPDGYLVKTEIVPGTAFRRKLAKDFSVHGLDFQIGEVINYIVLEHYLVFFTHLNKIFAWPIDGQEDPQHTPFEITSFYPQTGDAVLSDFHIQDIQGSFRTFAILTRSGAVLIGDQATIDAHRAISEPATYRDINSSLSNTTSSSLPLPRKPAALQRTSVLSLSFADYHFIALHAPGYVTTHGSNSIDDRLGLGESRIATFRGVKFLSDIYDNELQQEDEETLNAEIAAVERLFHSREWRDFDNEDEGDLVLPPWSSGQRRVWFEHEKYEWLRSLLNKWQTRVETELDMEWFISYLLKCVQTSRVESFAKDADAMAEWVERVAANWEKGPVGAGYDKSSNDDVDGEDHTGSSNSTKDKEATEDTAGLVTSAYFPFKIAAAGWHNAALVMVDEKRAQEVRNKWRIPLAQEKQQPQPQEQQPDTDTAKTTNNTTSSSWSLRSILSSISSPVEQKSEGEIPKARQEEEKEGDEGKYIWDAKDAIVPKFRLPSNRRWPSGGRWKEVGWRDGEPDFSKRKYADE